MSDEKVHHFDLAGARLLHRDAADLARARDTGNSLHTWDALPQRLRTNHCVVSFDRPGFGLMGPSSSGNYTMPYYAVFLRRFLDRMDIEWCVLIGSSAGGRVAWRFAASEPSRVERSRWLPENDPAGVRLSHRHVADRPAGLL